MGLEKVGLQAVLEGADKYAADAKKIRAAERGIAESQDDAAAAARQLEETRNKLALAQFNLVSATNELAQAEQDLANNTDPEKQRELEGAVLSARVAVDQEQNAVDGLQGEMSELSASTTEAAESTKQAGFSFTELNSVISLVQRGVQAARQVYEAVIAPTLELADAQRELALAGQITVEEAGKIIQIGDDLGISVSTLKTAFKEMAKDGIQPTLENIKQVAEEYQNAKTPTEALQIAQRSLGKSYQELLPLLEKTPQELDAMAESAEAAGIIMSGSAVKSAREYQIALDDLQDQALGVKVALSEWAFPPLTEFLRKTSEATQLIRVMNQAVASGKINWFDMQVITGKVQYGLMSTSDAIELVNSKLNQSTPVIGGWGAAWQGATTSITGAVGPLQQVVSAEDAFKNSTDLLQAQLNGPVRSAMETHTQSVTEIRDRTAELRGKIDELEGKRYLTDAQKEELAAAQAELEGMRGKIEEADAALQKEIQTFIISTLMAQSNSAEQVAAVSAIAESWGLLDARTGEVVTGTLEAWESFVTGKTTLEEFTASLNNTTAASTAFLPNSNELRHAFDAISSSGSNSKASVDSLIKSINNIPGEKTSVITTIFNEVLGTQRPGRAEGGPVFPNQTYRINEGGLQESMLSRRGLELLQGSTLRPRTPGFVIPADRTRALMANPMLGGGRGPSAGPVDMSRQVSVTANIYNQMSQAVFEQRLKAAIG